MELFYFCKIFEVGWGKNPKLGKFQWTLDKVKLKLISASN